jgi:hypothetical protein
MRLSVPGQISEREGERRSCQKWIAVSTAWDVHTHNRAARNILHGQRMVSRSLNMISPNERYDRWYAKAAFGILLFGLVGSLVALYSGVSDPLLVRLLDMLS